MGRRRRLGSHRPRPCAGDVTVRINPDLVTAVRVYPVAMIGSKQTLSGPWPYIIMMARVLCLVSPPRQEGT
jgi:hypothetical protein